MIPIALRIENLPPNLRNRFENQLLWGCVPGSYFDLVVVWKSFLMKSGNSKVNVSSPSQKASLAISTCSSMRLHGVCWLLCSLLRCSFTSCKWKVWLCVSQVRSKKKVVTSTNVGDPELEDIFQMRAKCILVLGDYPGRNGVGG